MRRLRLTTAALFLLLAGLTAACGGDDDGSGSATGSGSPTAPAGAGGALEVEAYDALEFNASVYETEAGEITFTYVNEGNTGHTLLVEDHEDDMKLLVKNKGDTDEGSLVLERGTYTLYCDVAGHQAGGMEAELTVT